MGIELWLDVEQGYCESLLALMTLPDVGIDDITVHKRSVRFLAIDRNIDATFMPNGGVIITDSMKGSAFGAIGPKRVIALRRKGFSKMMNNPLLCKKCFDFSGIYRTKKVGNTETHIPDAFICVHCSRTWEYIADNPQS